MSFREGIFRIGALFRNAFSIGAGFSCSLDFLTLEASTFCDFYYLGDLEYFGAFGEFGSLDFDNFGSSITFFGWEEPFFFISSIFSAVFSVP